MTQVNVSSGIANPAALADALRDSVLAGLNLVPVAGGFLSYLGALFIPGIGKSQEQMWREYTDQAISDALFRLMQADLIGLSNVARLYGDAVRANDNNALRAQSIAANTQFAALAPRFQLAGEQVRLLPLFAICATMHLSLLRDMTLTGKELGFNAAFIATLNEQLANRIDSYGKYVDQYVPQAIAQTRLDNPHGPALRQNQPLSAMLETKTRLQLSVIDLRDTWHAFDAERFPGPSLVKLDREIYTPIAGWWDHHSTPDHIPEWKAPSSPLRRIDVWERAQWRTRFLSAFSVTYEDGSGLTTGDRTGTQRAVTVPAGHHIKRVQTHASAGVFRTTFTYQNDQSFSIGRDVESSERRFSHEYLGHQLSSVRSIGKGRNAAENAVSGCIYGFQLVNKVARPASGETYSRLAEHMPSRLLDWVAGR